MNIKKIQTNIQLFNNLQKKAQISNSTNIELMFSKRDFININSFGSHIQIGTDEIEDIQIEKYTENRFLLRIYLKNEVYIEINDGNKISKYTYKIHD